MAKLTKRQRAFAEKIEEGRLYAIDEAVSIPIQRLLYPAYINKVIANT